MNQNKWVKHIERLNFHQYTKSSIINFFIKYHTKASFDFIPIRSNQLRKAFNNINNYKPLTICLDAEFQSAIIVEEHLFFDLNIKGDKYSSFIKEFGLLFFVTDIDYNFYYIGNLFMNFVQLDKLGDEKGMKGMKGIDLGFDQTDMRLLNSKYSTVSDNTLKQIEKIEKIFHLELILDDNLNNNYGKDITKYLANNALFNEFVPESNKPKILDITTKLDSDIDILQNELKYIKRQLSQVKFEVFGRYIHDEYLETYTKMQELYNTDHIVKKRIDVVQDLDYMLFFQNFEQVLGDSLLVIKGMRDVYAIKNMYKLFSNKDKELNLYNYYDIETFNGFSHNFYKNSQLEETYKGLIQTKIYKGIATDFFDQITENFEDNRAHNPLVDSLFTIVVAVVMNLVINTYFTSIINDSDNINQNRSNRPEFNTNRSRLSRTSKSNKSNKLNKLKIRKYKKNIKGGIGNKTCYELKYIKYKQKYLNLKVVN